jgi:hypothetical protein
MSNNNGINTYNFAVNHSEAAKMVATCGHDVTYVFEGEPGVGKSSILTTLSTMLGDEYEYIYVDVPNKDAPDIALCMPDHIKKVTAYYINETWLGADRTKKKCIMLDEINKGPEYVQLMMNRLVHEHVIGTYKLPEGSRVFGTTNFTTDGVGDSSNAHSNSRIVRVPFRKPSQEEYNHWGINNGLNPIVLKWCDQNPMIFQSYKDTEFNANEHKDGVGAFHYIFHPQHNTHAYVCPRSMHKASKQIDCIDTLGEALLVKALIGTIGAKAALDMSALIALGNDMPDPKDVVSAPESARIPKSEAAQIMLVYKSVQHLTPTNISAWVTYFERYPLEMLSVWVKTVIKNESVKMFFIKDPKIRAFAINNSWVL